MKYYLLKLLEIFISVISTRSFLFSTRLYLKIEFSIKLIFSIFDFNNNLLNLFVEQGSLIDNNSIIEKISLIENSIFKYNLVENKKLLVEITLMKISKSFKR
jgi:hypothetical protein